jgi:hypothetical protein
MKEIFETIGLLIPTIILIGLLLIVIEFYILLRKYLKLKIKFYSDKINEK